jgi:hypothetical protein
MTYTTISSGELHDRFEMPEKYGGYEARDPEGRRIGSVKELFTNVYGEPEYAGVRTGLGLKRLVLISVGLVAVDEERRTLSLG